MKKTASTLAIAVIALFGASASNAQSVYGQLGTTGITLGYAKHFSNYNLRGDINFLDYSREFNTDNTNYDAKLKFATVGLFADYFPVGQFRVTGGLTLGNDNITARGVAGPSSDIPEGEWATGQIKSKSVRPYIGVGWGLGPQSSKGLSFAADIGASYGKLRSEYAVSPGLQAYWGDSRVQAERQNFENKLNNYKWFPVVRIGVTYRY